MAAPQVPIEVEPETGRWMTDSLPMLYVPVHFFVNNHLAIEKELGVERYACLLYDAGYKSAWSWCEHEGEVHGLKGQAVFEHYMNRLSQRGWGQFEILDFDLDAATASVAVRHSVFHRPDEAGHRTGDYMFTGWFAGAMDQILSASGRAARTRAEQLFHEGQTDAPYGLFRVLPV
ncbi:DUF5943 domain-containing protein [Arthrobacter sp. M4]|uniref:DUF5943 domain-containing protein n=1 Tax=Arthrobacter sp. M4 TaxID=218160 RepID=UPI001CDBE793|nr:DUF5943 domain-containing protein [Arthrobacter sp. M4]MCA4135633.1 DUF5943 domain-containing protein [Arthrobacter sp. M4]